MTNHIFTLTDNNEFIQLDKLLKVMTLVSSGGEAHLVIQEGRVLFNDVVELQKRKKIRAGDKVQFNDQQIEVKA